MRHDLIDINVFADVIEPWPNQVFRNKFDAYILLSHPAFEYNPNGIFEPFGFLNNIGEKNLVVSSIKGTKKLHFSLDDDRQLYYDTYQENLADERYLVWHGDHDRWAMVSDSKYNVAVFGIVWDICGEPGFFYPQCLLSPIQFLEKVGKQNHLDVFMKNYQPSKVLTEGNEKNPMWVKYFFQCHVENENDKLFYWPQFEKIFHAIHPLLKHFKSLDMYANQAFERRHCRNKQWYSSGSNAPIGGWQKYSYKNCEKVANKYLNDNEHLRLRFEGKTAESDALYVATKKGLIEFFTFWIYASLNKVSHKGGQSDFYFLTTLHSFGNKNDAYNQNFNFSYRKDLLNERDVEKLVAELGKIGFAVKIYKVEKPYFFAVYNKDKALHTEGIYGGATQGFESFDNLILIK